MTKSMPHNAITDVPGIQVGHYTDLHAITGCTVVVCPKGTTCGVDVRGGAPGTRELALLDPTCMVQHVNAILLSGGSAFGLAAADGVMRWLEEHGQGFDTGVAKVPIVPAAILFDLAIGSATVRPDSAAGYAACAAAAAGLVAQGNVGAGTGCTVGKLLGFKQATKTGIGSASRQIGRGVIVGALVALNAVGEVIDPGSRRTVAGARQPLTGRFINSLEFAAGTLGQTLASMAGTNTTLAIIATNASLDKAGATKVAQMAHDGLARTIRPVHTHLDGDTIFALSTGKAKAAAGIVGAVAAEVLAEAVLNAVHAAESLGGLPAARDLKDA